MRAQRWLTRLRWPILLSALSVLPLTGCGRTVLVPPGEPFILGESVKAKVYHVVDGVTVRSDNRVVLSEGWWIVPDPDRLPE